MTFIHKDTINTQFLKSDNIILAALVVQLGKAGFQRFLGSLQLLNGIAFGLGAFCLLDTVHDVINLTVQDNFLTLSGHGDLFKLAVSDDDSIVISRSNTGTELLTVASFKVLFRCYKDIGRRIELEPLRCPLLGDVVRDDNQRLGTQSQTLALHGCCDHLEGLSCSYLVCQQRVSAVHDVSDGIDLMLSQSDFRIHAIEANMLPIILTGTERIKGFIVDPTQQFTATDVFPKPFGKLGFDQLLSILSDSCFFLIQHSLLVPMIVNDCIKNADVLLIQSLLQNVIGIDAFGAIGGDASDVAAVSTFVGDVPLTGSLGV